MVRKLLPHAVIIISMMYFVFFFIDKVNTAMNFINNPLTKGLLFALCVLSIAQSVMLIGDNRRRERLRASRAKAQGQSASRRSGAKAQPARTEKQ